MKTLCSLSLAALLTLSRLVPAWAQPTPLPGPPDDASCAQDLRAQDPHTRGGRATVATVLQVDHQLGVLHLETEVGRLLLFVAPDKLTNVQEGDQLTVCLGESEPAEQRPQDAIPA